MSNLAEADGIHSLIRELAYSTCGKGESIIFPVLLKRGHAQLILLMENIPNNHL